MTAADLFIAACPCAMRVEIAEQSEVTFVYVTARVGFSWPVARVRDEIRDAARETLPPDVPWLAVVNEVLVVRPAAITIRTSPALAVGDRVSWRHVEWSKIRAGSTTRMLLSRALDAALWWRRRDLHQVTRAGAGWMELERLRWSWRRWSYVLDSSLDRALADVLRGDPRARG